MRNGIAVAGAWICTMAFCIIIDYTVRDNIGDNAKRFDDARIDKFF
tara:strand:+ start:12027 stop:12164 length:138 start_codon:yes stop_codon:yes gene_type:complete